MNFVRVLIGAVFFRFSCTGEKSMRVWGGDLERVSLTIFSGYSIKAQCTGKPAYLPSVSHIHCRNQQGVYPHQHFTEKPRLNLYIRGL